MLFSKIEYNWRRGIFYDLWGKWHFCTAKNASLTEAGRRMIVVSVASVFIDQIVDNFIKQIDPYLLLTILK